MVARISGAVAPVLSIGSDGLLCKRQLAETLGVSERTIDNWIAGRRIPFLKLSPRMIRFRLERVRRALDAFEVKEVAL